MIVIPINEHGKTDRDALVRDVRSIEVERATAPDFLTAQEFILRMLTSTGAKLVTYVQQ